MGKILFRNFMNGEATRDRPKAELIQDGMDFVQTNSYMFNQYKKSEVMEKMIEKWQYS